MIEEKLMFRGCILGLVAILIHGGPTGSHAVEPQLPPGDERPFLRLESQGPRSFLSALAFSADGRALYGAGWDKLVQVWNRDANGFYTYNSAAGLRIPTGSGLQGGLNALALSNDGRWLAVAGLGAARELSDQRTAGWILPAGARGDASRLDEGTIFVFNLASRETILLRGHRGPIAALAFVHGSRSAIPELVSIAEDRLDNNQTKPEVRLWNVSVATTVAILNAAPNLSGTPVIPLPGLQGFRPGLVAWSAGPAIQQARVALAWGDNRFRIWDVSAGTVESLAAGDNLLTLLPLDQTMTRFLTGAHGQIGVWTVATQKTAQSAASQFQRSQIPEVNDQRFQIPNAAALIRDAKGDGHIAAFVITKYLADENGVPTGRARYRLLLASVNPVVKTLREIDLWEGTIRQPALAVSRDGSTLAVAGNPQNEIVLYSVNSLLDKTPASQNPPRLQTLASAGLQFDAAGFARNGERWGLKLNRTIPDRTGKSVPESLLFDLAARQISPATDPSWKSANSPAFSPAADTRQPGRVLVPRAEGGPLELKLENNHAATSVAVCPASGFCPIPLIAVASELRGQPLLQIFRGDTGEPLRWCVGHTERIRALAFSADGRMLVSVAEDRTTNVWTMTDLPTRVLNQRGRIPDLKLREENQRLLVTDPGSSPLQKEDEVLGFLTNQELTRIATPADFYRQTLRRKPGERLELSIRRQGAPNQVACPIGQAIDEAKPLFSVFVIPADRAGEWEWIGWNPSGNFDARGERVEHQLGWHFNTGKADHPAAFAPMSEYRQNFYQRELLQSLVEQQKLVLQVPQEKPRMALSWRHRDGVPIERDSANRPVVTSRRVELVAEVSGIATRRIQGLDATLSGQPAVAFKPGLNEEWIADLSGVAFNRGPQTVITRLATADREFETTETLQFQPRSPLIVWNQNWAGEIKSDAVEIAARIVPTEEPVQVELNVSAAGKATELIQSWTISPQDPPLVIARPVKLVPGENRVELKAWNTRTGDAARQFEVVQQVVTLQRALPAVAPRISPLVVSVLESKGNRELVANEHHRIITRQPTVAITGMITATAAIDQAEWRAGDARQPLRNFVAGKTPQWKVEETITLKPGPQTVLIHAAVEDQVAERRLEIDYWPLLPTIARLGFQRNPATKPLPEGVRRDPGVLVAGFDAEQVTFQAELETTANQELIGEFSLNGQILKTVMIPAGEKSAVATLNLRGGTNHCEFRIKDRWQAGDAKSFTIMLRRPVEQLEARANDVSLAEPQTFTGQPFELTSAARSVLPLLSATLRIDDRPAEKLAIIRDNQKPDQWRLNSVGKIGLTEGDHLLRIDAANADGDALLSGIYPVRVRSPQPPELELLRPGSPQITIGSDLFEMEYAVKSKLPVETMVRVLGADGPVEQSASAVPHPGDALSVKRTVRVVAGLNRISLSATSSEGSAQTEFTVSYVPQAVAVELTSLNGQAPDLETLWENGEKTAYLKQEIPRDQLPLVGRVTARDSLADRGRLEARIWVNSFKLPTVPARLDPSNPHVANFETDIVLNRKKKNQIRVQIFSSQRGPQPVELGNAGTTLIDCAQPVPDQKLFLLLMGTGDDQLMEREAETFLAVTQKIKPGLWRSASFSEIHVLKAINDSGPVVQFQINRLKGLMENQLRSHPRAASSSIVMVIFQGKIQLAKSEFKFQTSGAEADADEFLSGKLLEERLAKTYGAHLLLMDLRQESIRQEDIWPKAPHLGIFVKNWNSPGPLPPVGSRLISDLQPKYPAVRELAESIQQKVANFPGRIETLDLLRNHYDLRFGGLD